MKPTKLLSEERKCKACESLKKIGSNSPCGIHYGRYCQPPQDTQDKSTTGKVKVKGLPDTQEIQAPEISVPSQEKQVMLIVFEGVIRGI